MIKYCQKSDSIYDDETGKWKESLCGYPECNYCKYKGTEHPKDCPGKHFDVKLTKSGKSFIAD